MIYRAFSGSSVGKKNICLQSRKPWFDSWVGKIFWRMDRLCTPVFLGFPCGSAGKNLTAIRKTWVRSLGWEDALEKRGHSLWCFGLENSSIQLYSPWVRKESDTTVLFRDKGPCCLSILYIIVGIC